MLYFCIVTKYKIEQTFPSTIANFRVTQKNHHVLFSLCDPPAGAKIRVTHRAEETSATSKTRRSATSERAGCRVKTIAYNWHMKFKGGVTRRAVRVERPAAHSIHPRCSSPYSFLVLPPRWKFTFPPCCWNCLFIPLSFKEPLVAILPLPYRPRIPVNLPFAPPTPFDTALRRTRSTSSRATETILHLRRRLRFVGR